MKKLNMSKSSATSTTTQLTTTTTTTKRKAPESTQQNKKAAKTQQKRKAVVDQAATVAVTPIAGGIQKVVQNTVSQSQVSQPTIVASTSGVTETQLATIETAASPATVVTVTDTPLAKAAIRQRAPVTVQDIGTSATVVGPVANTLPQVRAQLQGTATSVTSTLQLSQRITAATATNSVPQGSKPLTQQQIQLFQQQQNIMNRQKHLQQQQQQQFKMQKVTIDPRQQQQLQQVKRQVVQGPKTVIHQQLVTSMAQGPLKQGGQIARTLTQEEIARLNTQQKLGSGQALVGTQIQQTAQGTQIIGTPSQPVSSQALSKVSGQQAGATLVKTVSAPPGNMSNVSINVSMPQKGVEKVSHLSQMQLLQHRKQIPVQKGLTAGQKVAPQMVSAVQIIQQQTRGGSLTVQQLQQIMKQQMIHTGTSQPTIIATVTQSQPTPQMVTKVLATSANVQPSQLQSVPASATVISGQTMSSSTASPIVTLSQVPVPSLGITSLPSGQSSMTASIVKPGSGGEAVTTVQIHPIGTIGQQSKLTGVP